MTTLRMRAVMPMLVALWACAAPVALAAQDSLDELQARFKERYRQLLELKMDGKIGETSDGLVELTAAVYRNDRVAKLADAENRDRKRLYELLAEDLRAKAAPDERDAITAETVARRNARRNFTQARPTEYLLMPDGVWIQAQDLAAHERILKYKEDGLVGETAQGYLAVRADGSRATPVVDGENGRRRSFYGVIAMLGHEPVEKVAAGYGKAHLEAARPGDWVRTAAGDWKKGSELDL